MRSTLAAFLRNLIIPFGAKSTDSAVILEGQPEAILLASNQQAAVIWQYSPDGITRRAFIASVEPNPGIGGEWHLFETDFQNPLFKQNILDVQADVSGALRILLDGGNIDIVQPALGDPTTTITGVLALTDSASSNGILITPATPTIETVLAGTTETWHALGFLNGFSNRGAGFATFAYRKTPSPANAIQLVGQIVSGATVASGTQIATLPAGYRPATEIATIVVDASSVPPAPLAMTVATTGAVKLFGTWANTHIIQINTIIPLDH